MRNSTRPRTRWLCGLLAVVAGSIAPVSVTTPAHAKPGPFYKIVALHSGKVLMPFGQAKSTMTHIVQATDGNLGAQHWKIERYDDGKNIRALRNRHSHLCIAVIPGDPLLRQMTCNLPVIGQPNAAWRTSNYDDMWSARPIVWQSGLTGNCMDVWNASDAESEWVQHYPCHGGLNQQFRLVHVSGT